MDESALQDRLDRIERRQNLVLVLLVVPYLVVVADRIGYAVAGVLYTLLALITLAVVTASRRRNRETTER